MRTGIRWEHRPITGQGLFWGTQADTGQPAARLVMQPRGRESKFRRSRAGKTGGGGDCDKLESPKGQPLVSPCRCPCRGETQGQGAELGVQNDTAHLTCVTPPSS